MEKYFITLDPEEKLINLINKQKKLVRDFVGEQEYLLDPPHFTLFRLKLKTPNKTLSKLEEITKNIEKFPINITGFHTFYDDLQTQKNTITYSLSQQNIKYFRKIQLQIVNLLNKVNTKKFYTKDEDIYQKMSGIEKLNVDNFGFPFVGKNWIPHITIVSIEKDKFDKVFEELRKNNDVKGEFFIDSMSLYKILEKPILIKNFKLKENV